MKNKRIIVFFLFFAIFLTSCKFNAQNKEVNQNFYNIYTSKTTLDEFCGNHKDYMINIDIEKTTVQLVLKKDDIGQWSGGLKLYDELKGESQKLVEEIPIVIINNEIVIQSTEEKKVPVTIWFFNHFDIEKCKIKESASDVIGIPLTEEMIGDYPIKDIKSYMEMFYNEIISNLNLFDRKDDYFSAISELDSFVFNRQRSKNPCYKLSFGFTGNEEVKWDLAFGKMGSVSMVFSERSPIAW